jgi:hypothetical protein
MFKYNNTHIFTGYLKQLLSSFNLPTCKIYTHEFAKYLEVNGEEDPRVLESFDTQNEDRLAVRINYLKNNELYHYYSNKPDPNRSGLTWKRSADVFYSSDKVVRGLTRSLRDSSIEYDSTTHEYLGEYLRFLRDYHNINLMSLYNCFNNKICNNIYFNFLVSSAAGHASSVTFSSQDSNYRIYAIPVKLFSKYTIAIDCSQGIEMFCGFYNNNLEVSSKAEELAAKTYTKIHRSIFNQPIIYDKLDITKWPASNDFIIYEAPNSVSQIRTDKFTRWDLATREHDLRLFIKVPVSCKSSITILEGDYREFNSYRYTPAKYNADGTLFDPEVNENKNLRTVWEYKQNHSVLNFNTKKILAVNNTGDGLNLNDYAFKPISKLQLLAFNTGESYPFADRLVEYLSGSAITPIDPIVDNIKRVQRVMKQNRNYFKIEGLWEDKMKNILYDYIMSAGPIEIVTIGDDRENDPANYGKKIYNLTDYKFKTKQVLRDRHTGNNPKNYGYHPVLGHRSKSSLYDVLGYVDKDAEKLYASWFKQDNKAQTKSTIQDVDIYDGLYDI